jgi:hypothetical protein
MDASYSSVNIVTMVLIGIAVLVMLSVFTLGVYFFGGSSPLERNAKGRIEANLKPEEVLTAHRQYNRFRFVFALSVMTGLYLILRRSAPVETAQATDALLEALSVTLNKLRELLAGLLQGM